MLSKCIRPHVVKNAFSVTVVPGAPYGEAVEKKFTIKRDSNFNTVYVEVPGGEFNVSEYVNSFKTGCDLQFILNRCSLMPTRDVVNMLQQTENGVSADLTSLPSDLTDALIRVRELKESNPDIFNRLSKGESIDSIIKTILPKSESVEVTNEMKKEGDVNGTN